MFEKHFELNEDTIPIAEDKQQSRWYVTMKKRLVLIINASLMLVILAFVAFFSNQENSEHYLRQVEAFESTSSATERVTENYLEGEQQICDV